MFTQKSGKCREAHPEVRYGSRGPPGGPDLVWICTRRFGRGWQRLGSPPGGPGVVGWPTRWFGIGQKAHLEVWVRLGVPLGNSGGVQRPPGGP